MDLVSVSSERLQPLPQDPSKPLPSPSDDVLWLEEVSEKAKRGVVEAQFALGQYFFEKGQYRDASQQFELAAHRGNMQARYQLGGMFYDGKGVEEDSVSGGVRPLFPPVSFTRSGQSKGFHFMMEVVENARHGDAHLVPSAQYNIGRAFFQGFGVRQSDEEAVKWWTRSAEQGKDPGSVRAQNTLGMYYARNENVNAKEVSI